MWGRQPGPGKRSRSLSQTLVAYVLRKVNLADPLVGTIVVASTRLYATTSLVSISVAKSVCSNDPEGQAFAVVIVSASAMVGPTTKIDVRELQPSQ